MRDILYPLRKLHGIMHEWRTKVLPLYIERFRNPHSVYLVLTPEHGNLGDHAIAESESTLLNECGMSYIEITGEKLREMKSNGSLSVMNGRPIFINGGGNLGTLWFDVELLIREVVLKNPKSKICIFPSTFYYEHDENGSLELERSKTIYNSHRHLKIYARELISYNNMKEIYRDVSIAPDMVLRIDKSQKAEKRQGAILCLRKDLEKKITEDFEIRIRAEVTSLFDDDVCELDMVKPYQIPVLNRSRELEKQFNAFKKAKLVVTDRLHGMIFCAITGTPCIVIDSKSPKVKGCYEWIKDLPYIQFCADPSELSEKYSSIPEQPWKYDRSKMLPLYENIIEYIEKNISR